VSIKIQDRKNGSLLAAQWQFEVGGARGDMPLAASRGNQAFLHPTNQPPIVM
jgi:hypothetical protein